MEDNSSSKYSYLRFAFVMALTPHTFTIINRMVELVKLGRGSRSMGIFY